ncbi:MAG: CPBP family intramembrane glutamic endopeptidase [Oscillospiraceae bacterium]
MSNKALTIKRIIIFCVIACVPFWIIVPIMNAVFGEPIYECESAAAAVYALGVFGMLIPAVANLITRLVTKEGFKDSYLGLNFKGNAKYYRASVAVIIAESVICLILIWAFYAKGLPFSEAFSADNMNTKLGAFMLQLSMSMIVFFPAFGEEWGWRGYLMPKLMEVMGKPAAIVVGGIIWGLWHAPLTMAGHNFGTGYSFYPCGGILVMCVACTLMNAFLTLLTEKTKSIYPASFAHMINNNLGSSILLMLFGSEAMLVKVVDVSNIKMYLTVCLPITAITGVISVVLLMKKKN